MTDHQAHRVAAQMNEAAIPSQNLQAEENVLGAILLNESIPPDVLATVTPKDFYRQSHGRIFDAMILLNADGKPTTGIAVADKLEKLGQLDHVGGSGRIAELMALTPTVSNTIHHAKIVHDHSIVRGLRKVGLEIQALADNRPGEVDDLIRRAEGLLHNASDRTTTLSAAPLIVDLDSYLADVRTAIETNTPMVGASTGFRGVDSMLRGMWPGQLLILAALTGKGKSAFALNLAENVVDGGKAVLFVSLEMSRLELLIRSLSRAGSIDSDLLSTGDLDANDQMKMPAAIEKVRSRGNKLLVHDQGLSNPAMLASIARRHHKADPLGLIVVDYIGLMQGEGETQTLRVASISRALKLLAMQLHVPVLGLAQFNRSFAGRVNKEPMLTDLKDTSSLEQDADVVMFLHSEADHDPGIEDKGGVKLIVAKNRRGKSGTVELLYVRKYNRFSTPHMTGDTAL